MWSFEPQLQRRATPTSGPWENQQCIFAVIVVATIVRIIINIIFIIGINIIIIININIIIELRGRATIGRLGADRYRRHASHFADLR